ncbi:MAG TPA: HAMP domain-containing sensor histidine kinase [Baekduia sp.]|uniref:HAMP domain-containing sensor histidine kinase n=1 Tax=Baekduia sp. TaxID=2600305 RepID=UPI002BC5031E|nr:HAMP domain-containing sensor histidine kinase [Baekduia sp.]HMJ32352.1 HAMP domain-containing sensor histidine kinase [Baekduia sp.]
MRFGIRERFVALLAVLCALTLAVAAVGLFSPLDRLLRDAARETLAQSVHSELGDFTALPSEAVHPGDRRLLAAMRPLRRTGADVAVLDGSGRVLATTDPGREEPFVAAHDAVRTGKERRLVVGGSQPEAEIAVPVHIDGVPAIVAARRPIEDVEAVTRLLRRAFALAAVAGLLGAVLMGVLIAGRAVGRIRRLRDTAERVAQVGPVAEFQPEGGRDEIGDLSRTFAVMQTRLREQEQARRAFVATASHELRTPVASLQVMLDLLIADLDAEPAAIADARQQARSADEQAGRLSQLAGELLDLSRIDAGLPFRREPVALGEVLRSVVAEQQVRLGGEGRSVGIADGEDRWALADPGNVARILRILIDNALRHTAAPGGVWTQLTTDGDRTGIAVQDEGPGIAAEDRERIFERFVRGVEAQPGGFGLGLAIGRELARRMGGDLVLEDTAAGARFILWLPRATAP